MIISHKFLALVSIIDVVQTVSMSRIAVLPVFLKILEFLLATPGRTFDFTYFVPSVSKGLHMPSHSFNRVSLVMEFLIWWVKIRQIKQYLLWTGVRPSLQKLGTILENRVTKIEVIKKRSPKLIIFWINWGHFQMKINFIRLKCDLDIWNCLWKSDLGTFWWDHPF